MSLFWLIVPKKSSILRRMVQRLVVSAGSCLIRFYLYSGRKDQELDMKSAYKFSKPASSNTSSIKIPHLESFITSQNSIQVSGDYSHSY